MGTSRMRGTAIAVATGVALALATSAPALAADTVSPTMTVPAAALPAPPAGQTWNVKLAADLNRVRMNATAGAASVTGIIFSTGRYEFTAALTNYRFRGGSINASGSISGTNIFRPEAITGITGSITGAVPVGPNTEIQGGTVTWTRSGLSFNGSLRLQCSKGFLDASAQGTLVDSDNFSLSATGTAGDCVLGKQAAFEGRTFLASIAAKDGALTYDGSIAAEKISLGSMWIDRDEEIASNLYFARGRITNTCATCTEGRLRVTFSGRAIAELRTWRVAPAYRGDHRPPSYRPRNEIVLRRAPTTLEGTAAGGITLWGDTYGQVEVDLTNLGLNGITLLRRLLVKHTLHGSLIVSFGGKSPYPAPGVDVFEDGATLAAGASHTCAMSTGGVVACWGYNVYGQLGDGMRTSTRSPVRTLNLTDASAIAAGRMHTCAVRTGGTVACWGYNALGQLGDGTTTSNRYLVTVPGIEDAKAVAAGDLHTCVLRGTGTVSCWGSNAYGQLGNGATASSRTPVTVSGITDATAIAAGENFTCAVRESGAVSCWGYNGYGQLGNGTITTSRVPVTVSGIADAVSIAAGEHHACVVRDDERVSCWGSNALGQLGDGTVTTSRTPVAVLGLEAVTQLAAGDLHTCAILDDDGVRCWGSNAYGQLGNGTRTSSRTPVVASGIAGAYALSAGPSSTCAILNTHTGHVRCWGYNGLGQLGDGTLTTRPLPTSVLNL